MYFWLPCWTLLWCDMSPDIIGQCSDDCQGHGPPGAPLWSQNSQKTKPTSTFLLQLSFNKTARVVYVKYELDHIIPCLQALQWHPTTHLEWLTKAWKALAASLTSNLTEGWRMMRETDWVGLSESHFSWPWWTRHVCLDALSSDEAPNSIPWHPCTYISDFPRSECWRASISSYLQHCPLKSHQAEALQSK